jgi:hypothetical protein
VFGMPDLHVSHHIDRTAGKEARHFWLWLQHAWISCCHPGRQHLTAALCTCQMRLTCRQVCMQFFGACYLCQVEYVAEAGIPGVEVTQLVALAAAAPHITSSVT